MSEATEDYTLGYGKPPVGSRFPKGQSGNPGGRPRRTKNLPVLLVEALSRRSGLPNPDGSWMTQAEAIFLNLVAQASGPDLKAKRLLFDLLIKLQRANHGWPSERLPEIQLDDSEDANLIVAADIARGVEEMRRDAIARGGLPRIAGAAAEEAAVPVVVPPLTPVSDAEGQRDHVAAPR